MHSREADKNFSSITAAGLGASRYQAQWRAESFLRVAQELQRSRGGNEAAHHP